MSRHGGCEAVRGGECLFSLHLTSNLDPWQSRHGIGENAAIRLESFSTDTFQWKKNEKKMATWGIAWLSNEIESQTSHCRHLLVLSGLSWVSTWPEVHRIKRSAHICLFIVCLRTEWEEVYCSRSADQTRPASKFGATLCTQKINEHKQRLLYSILLNSFMDNARKLPFVLFHTWQWSYDNIKLNHIALETAKNVKTSVGVCWCAHWHSVGYLSTCHSISHFLTRRGKPELLPTDVKDKNLREH